MKSENKTFLIKVTTLLRKFVKDANKLHKKKVKKASYVVIAIPDSK